MNYYYDGPNGVGKDTLIKMEHPELSMKHYTGDDPNTYFFYKKEFSVNKTVFNRGPIGELVYSQVYHRDPRITFDQVVELLAKERVITTVVLVNNVETLRKRLATRDEKRDLYKRIGLTKALTLFTKYALELKALGLATIVYTDLED